MSSCHQKRCVVVVTHEYPPSAGAGVQRVAKLTRYLPEYGFEPVVVTSEPAWGRVTDEALAEEVASVSVVRLPARSVSASVARALSGIKQLRGRSGSAASAGNAPVGGAAGASMPLSGRIARWVSVPDDAVRWARDAADAAVELGRASGAVAVFASGPPHSVLMAGERAARRLGVPFVADMRDAWSTNPGAWWPTSAHRRRSLSLESEVMSAAAAVTVVSAPIAAEARSHGARTVEVIPNGYDASDMVPLSPRSGATLHLAFMGRFYGLTDPAPLLEALSAAREAGVDAVLHVIGPQTDRLTSLIAQYRLGDAVVIHGYLPHHEALAEVARSDAGLIVIADVPGAEAVYTGKLFEYLGMGLPVVVLGPLAGAASELVTELQAGWSVAYDDVPGLTTLIGQLAAEKVAGGVRTQLDTSGVARYERKSQAEHFAQIIAGAVDGPRA